jgi:pimeloyl-ACP methyl ester carboxylesterase
MAGRIIRSGSPMWRRGFKAKASKTIAPWLRGFGPTVFRSPDTLRDGRSLVLAQDALDLLDALGIERCMVLGHDWGGRAAYHLAALAPDRIEAIAVLAIGYAPFGRYVTPGFEQAKRWWYQWYMNSEGGARQVRADPIGFAHQQWDDWSPPGWYDAEAFARTAASFQNPDWVSITLHGYRTRWLPVNCDDRYDKAAAIIDSTGELATPTLLIVGDADQCDSPVASAEDHRWFKSAYRRSCCPALGISPAVKPRPRSPKP